MDVRQLEYFLAVVDNGGFNRAARALYLAQPSLSQAIRALERDLGSPLFHRIGRGVVLTEEGNALVEPARQAVRSLAVARASVDSVHGLTSGQLAVASMPSPAVEPLTTMVERFTARHRGVSVVVKDAPVPQRVIEYVHTGVTEVGLLSAWEMPAASEVVSQTIERQRFVLVANADGPFRPGQLVRPSELAGQRLIVGERGTGIRGLVERIRADGVDLTIAVETEHREAVLPLVLKGVGIGVLAAAWRPLAERAGAMVLDLDHDARLSLIMISRRGWLSPAAEEFLSIGRDLARPATP